MENPKNRIFHKIKFPILVIAGVVAFTCYVGWREHKVNNAVVDQALGGNPYAVKILKQYDKPWKLNERVLQEALQGNIHALEILNIE